MDEQDILEKIRTLVAREHQLRDQVQSGELGLDDEHGQLKGVEEALDQCWDLLRQRRARREYGQNPDESAARPVDQVEHYLQ